MSVGKMYLSAHVAISTIDSEDADERIVYMKDLEKRKQVYGICGECKEPGTGFLWCQLCNAKRFKDNFKNWTSENKNIDKFIQQSQLNALNCGFGKIYLEGNINYWDIENQKWYRYALNSLNNSSDISSEFFR
ncbi:hypothetical protein C1646_749827 [Rhizophagus diaphanus]|nr:hypothetical protein C1646_749827 [Rhizophagus diaphanus] [Rhizophagus sp. MUCL 43196]